MLSLHPAHCLINTTPMCNGITAFQHSDMNEEMRLEVVEISITACEKFAHNYEVITLSLMDRVRLYPDKIPCIYRLQLEQLRTQWIKNLEPSGMWSLVKVSASKLNTKRRI